MAKRKKDYVVTMTVALFLHNKVKYFWREVLKISIYIIDRLPLKTLSFPTILMKTNLTSKHLDVWHIHHLVYKLNSRGFKYIFMG